MKPWIYSAALLWGALRPCEAFSSASLRRTSLSLLHSKKDGNEESFQDSAQELKRARERAHNAEIVDDLFRSNLSSNNRNVRPLMDLALVGRGTVGAWAQPQRSLGSQVQEKQKPIQCVFLSTPEASDEVIAHYLKRRYPDWEVPPDLKTKSTISSSSSCPDIPAVPLPIPLTRETSKELKLMSFAFRGRPVSKSVFLPLAKLLTDRDGGLWDNLPWTEWTIDPQHNVPKHYAETKAGKKYLLGRRDAYNRMIGKDWYGRSLSAGNVAARIKYDLEGDDDDDETKEDDSDKVKMESSLAFRILQVQLQEASMELAEAEKTYAIVKARFDENEFTSDEVLMAHYEEIKASVDQVDQAMQAKKAAEEALEELKNPSQASETQLEATVNEFLENLVQSRYMGKDKSEKADGDSKGWKDAAHKFVEGIRNQDNLLKDLGTILDREATNKWKHPFITFLDGVIERESRNAPPYRGAMGYAPQVDTKEEMFQKAVLPYRSPYDLLVEIIEEQFNAQVVGTVLENSSLFPGTLILEGAVVLRRRGNIKTVTIGGEVVELEDSQDDMGNRGVKMGETIVVECSGAEAIGMSLACNIPLSVERKVWEEAVTDIALSQKVEPLPSHQKESVMNTIPPVKQAPNSSNRVTVTEGGEALIGGQKSEENEDEETAVDMDRIRSLADYDALEVPEKARMILSSGKFEGTLPRPRSLRQFERELKVFRNLRREYIAKKKEDQEQEAPWIRTTLSPLDEILVSLLEDESVRLEILRRDAFRRDDQLAIDSIQRTIDELDEAKGQEKKTEKDDNIPSISIRRTLDEHLFKKEIEDKIQTKDETEEEEEPSIFE